MPRTRIVTEQQSDDRTRFTVAPTTIPVGVQCRGCGRDHLPLRLWPIAIRTTTDGPTEVELRCVRCNTIGTLTLDPRDTNHRGLLAIWHEQRADAHPTIRNPQGRP
jgi:hypothetical protein